MDVDFIYEHHKNSRSFAFDTRIVKKELNGIPLNNPEVINFLRKKLANEFKKIRIKH